MSQSAATISLEQYLSTSYRPDVEFLDGALKEKPLVSPVHGRVQVLLGMWFGMHEEDWGIQTLAEARTQVTRHSVRLPDITVLISGPLPRRALVDPPLLVIEVLSETETYADLKARAFDLASMGVENIWLIDPAMRTAERWSEGAWLPVADDTLSIAGSPVYLDLAWLWKKLRPEI